MQTPNLRYAILIGVLLVGGALYAAMGQPRGLGTPRWPRDDSLYQVDGWSVSPQQDAPGGFQDRTFRSASGSTATLSIFSNQAPKLYEAGAEVPFLGNGYSVEPAPQVAAESLANGTHALVAQMGSERWLVVYAFGERRGFLGNGPLAWTLAFTDLILGRPNDYYKLFLMARFDRSDSTQAQQLVALSSVIFPRIAGFYAS